MTTNDTKIYPTEEDLFIKHKDGLPVISFQGNLLPRVNSPNFNKESLTESGESHKEYVDNQIIPWRKLYTKKRQDDQKLLKTSDSSRLAIIFLKYNKWPILICSSILITIASIGLDWLLTWLSNLKFGYCEGNFFSVQESCADGQWNPHFSGLNPFFSFILGLLLLIILALGYSNLGLFISEKKCWTHQSGISELYLIISGKINKEFFKPEVIWRKYASLIFICASGSLLLGFEGPLVHISCGIIYCMIEIASTKLHVFSSLNNEAVKREILSIGFVIGISLAFGAPIGGLLFSAENLYLGTKLNSLLWNGFVCSSIATFLLFKIHPFKKVDISEAFKVEIGNGWILFESIPYLFVGLLCGMSALAYIKLHMKLIDYKRSKISSHADDGKICNILKNPFLEISILVTITWVLLYPVKFMRLTLNDVLRTLFRDCSTEDSGFLQSLCDSNFKLVELFYSFVVLFVQSNYAYSLKIPGGILLPSLTLGAFVGRIIGEIVQMIQTKAGSGIFLQCYTNNRNCVSPGSYAIVGAASFFAGVTNTSVAAVVIVFELTGAVTYLIPLMLGVAVSKSLVDLFDSKSFYELWLTKTSDGYVSADLAESLRLSKYAKVPVSQIIGDYEPDIIYTEDEGITVGKMKEKLELVYDTLASSEVVNDGITVLNNKSDLALVGWINYHDLHECLKFEVDGLDRKIKLLDSNEDGTNFLDLSGIFIHSRELLIVNQNYSVLSAFDLMNQMNITNIFITATNKSGEQFKAILKLSDLSKLLNN